MSLKGDEGIVRVNVYRSKETGKMYPVLVTYGPYGKDIHYSKLVLPNIKLSSYRVSKVL